MFQLSLPAKQGDSLIAWSAHNHFQTIIVINYLFKAFSAPKKLPALKGCIDEYLLLGWWLSLKWNGALCRDNCWIWAQSLLFVSESLYWLVCGSSDNKPQNEGGGEKLLTHSCKTPFWKEKKPEVGRNGADWVNSKKLTKVTNVITWACLKFNSLHNGALNCF